MFFAIAGAGIQVRSGISEMISLRLLPIPLTYGVLIVVTATTRHSHAAVITNSVEIDLGQVTITDDLNGGQWLFGGLTTGVSVTPFTPLPGDILQTTISFKNGDRLKIIDGPNAVDNVGPDYFDNLVFYFTGPDITGFHSTFTTDVVFSNLQGSLSDPTPGGSSTGILAQALYPDFTDSELSFDGLIMTTTIITVPEIGIYDSFGLWGGRAGGYEVISANTAAVPAPPSLALLGIGGLMLLGYRQRRRPKLLCS